MPTNASTRQAVGKRKALVECDEIPAGGNGIDAGRPFPQRAGVHYVGGKRFVGLVLGRGKIERDVGLLECGNLVVAGILGIGLMLRSIDHVQVQAVLTFADDDGFLGQRDLGVGGVAEIRHEHALPHGGALRSLHILDIENLLRKSLVENAGLDFEGNLGAFEAVFEVA